MSASLKKKFEKIVVKEQESWQRFFYPLLQKTSFKNSPVGLQQAMLYSLEAGGKRLRPLLALQMASLFKLPKQQAQKISLSLECLHTYSLIHDDLPAMDNDNFRRGKPSNHKKFGEDIAILSGDALQTLAFELLALANAQSSTIVYFAQCVGSAGMVGGQFWDMSSGHSNTLKTKSEKTSYLLQLHQAKTGRLIEASIVLPFLFFLQSQEKKNKKEARKQKLQLAKIKKWALKLGLLFQITDDILDVKGNAHKLGKSIGKDVQQEKITFVQLYGLAESQKMATEISKSLEKQANKVFEKNDFFCYLPRYVLLREY